MTNLPLGVIARASVETTPVSFSTPVPDMTHGKFVVENVK